MIFSDESKYNLFGSDRKRIVWQRKNTELNKENMCRTVKHGGASVLVWSCMGSNGVGNLEFIDGIMDKYKYVSILQQNLQPSVEKLNMPPIYYFQ